MYFFKTEIEKNSENLQVLIIFAGQGEDLEIDYSSQFEKQFKFFTKPDEVFFIYPAYIKSDIEKYFTIGTSFYENITRFGDLVPVTTLSFNKYGDFHPIYLITGTSFGGYLDELKSLVIERGLMDLASKKKNKIILKAPSGTTFSKPSERLKSEFIKTSEIAIGYYECQFVAYCLLATAPRKYKIKNIYIDSASISMYIEALLYYWSKFDRLKCKGTKYFSFGSYEGMEKARPDVTSDCWIIISASSSNGLGIKIAKDWGLNHEQVLTMLSFNDSQEGTVGDKILLNISSLSEEETYERNYGSLIHVNLVGENFTAQMEKPNAVLITQDHITSEITQWISKLKDNPAIDCGHYIGKQKKSCSIFFDTKKYIENSSEYQGWMESLIAWHMPVNTKWIIYDKNNESSNLIITKIRVILEKFGLKDVVYIDINDDFDGINGSYAVMIISPIVRTGSSLLNINRKLRLSQHQGNRVFISLFSIFSSKEEFNKFKSSVTYGPSGKKYTFLSHRCAFIGHAEGKNSWQLELEVTEKLPHKQWEKRDTILRNLSNGLSSKIGLSSKSFDKKLLFSKDFAFWKESYEARKVNHSVVYLTISSILQGLREKPFTFKDNSSLQSHVYQHSVISPENFNRFNDPLLHSCLWRSAYFRELDYRGSPELSERICQVIKELIDKHLNHEETAMLDILMGVAIGKIQLYKKSLEELVMYSKAKLANEEAIVLLLQYIDRKFSISDDREDNSFPL